MGIGKRGKHESSAGGADEYGRASSELYSQRRRSRRRRSNLLRGTVIALLLIFLGGGAAFLLWVDNVQSRMNNKQVITQDLRQVLEKPAKPNDPYYVLLLGTDGRPGETIYRADTIILARVDPPRKKVTLLSIPRDTMVEWKGSTMKINGVHAYDGAAGMVEIVSEKCGVKISHYAEVSFDGLAALTDALGGVTVDVDQYMHDDQNFEDVTELQPGVQTLNGDQALFYCRCRHFPDGDFTRMRHQRTFIKAMLRQVLSTSDPGRIVGLVNATGDVITTDLSVSQIIELASEMSGMNTETGLYSTNVPAEPKMVGGVSYLIADWNALDKMMKVIDAGGDPSTLDADGNAQVDASSEADRTQEGRLEGLSSMRAVSLADDLGASPAATSTKESGASRD